MNGSRSRSDSPRVPSALRRDRSRLNRFRCGRGRSNCITAKRNFVDLELFEADGTVQTTNREERTVRSFPGGTNVVFTVSKRTRFGRLFESKKKKKKTRDTFNLVS